VEDRSEDNVAEPSK